MRRLIALASPFVLSLALPAASWAAESTEKLDKPAGTDHTLTTIFVVALGIPLLLAILTLIDVGSGKHTDRRDH